MNTEKHAPDTQEMDAQDTSASTPTKEQVIAFFQEQIEVKKVQVELQELNTKHAMLRAEELKALSFIAQMTNPKPTGTEYAGQGREHVVTQEDMDNNPSLAEQGIKVGDTVFINEEAVEKEPSKKRQLNKR